MTVRLAWRLSRLQHFPTAPTAIEAVLIRQIIQLSSDDMSWDDHSALIRGGLVPRLQDVRKLPSDKPRLMMPAWAVARAESEAAFTVDRLRDLGIRLRLSGEPPQGAHAGGR